MAAVACAGIAQAAETAPRRRPAEGEALVLELPAAALVRAAPGDAAAAAAGARALLELARATGDTRYVGRAAALIEPWQGAQRVLPAIDLVAADLDQQRHDFAAARRRLDRVLAASPDAAGARLSRANVALLTGDLAAAQRDCRAVPAAGALASGTVCLASAASGPGSLERGRRLLAALRIDAVDAPDLARYRLMTAADLAGRAGEARAAAALLETAHAIAPAHEEARTRLAEAALAAGDAGRALVVADAPRPSLARLLVRMRAAQVLDDPRAPAFARDVAAALQLAQRRGEAPHDREQAAFALHAGGDAAGALAFARRNFAGQKDTPDLRMLVEAAVAARDADALQLARRWMQASGFQDRAADASLRGAGA